MSNKQGSSLGDFLYNFGWCYGKMMLEEQNKQKKEKYRVLCNRFFDQSYCLVEFYRQQSVQPFIKDKRKIWNLEAKVE